MIESTRGVLDLLIVARSAALPQFAPYLPTGLVYEICPRPVDGSAQCPAAAAGDTEYGGTRLQLSPGDVLKIHLVNRLPPNPATYARSVDDDFLKLNPTNLHLHGLLVSPRYATADDATWGDNVFVYNFNSANGAPAFGSNLHGTEIFDAVDYRIPIPLDHPSGLYWFHPHMHGISQNQIAAGLSGILTVGRVSDYLCRGGSCGPDLETAFGVRHLILKDAQIATDGALLSWPRTDFCGDAAPISGAGNAAGQGGCAGADNSTTGGSDFSGGRWYFTINGQEYPTITVAERTGQLLRIVNSSANAIYDLTLWNSTEQRAMAMQVISIDGVSVDASVSSTATAMNKMTGGRIAGFSSGQVSADAPHSVCTTRLLMMPSSRAEVWVRYRDANGVASLAPPGAAAVLRTSGFQDGPAGENWPAIDLAYVRFGSAARAVGEVSVVNRHAQAMYPGAAWRSLQAANADVPADPACAPLAPGHWRRIFFNTVPGYGYGLGYEEVDESGIPVPGTFSDVRPFDPTSPTVCLPLAAGNQPVSERWELVNLSAAVHNFHVHNAHFAVLTAADLAATVVPSKLWGRPVLMDNLPLRHADGHCATVADWRNGACTVYVSNVEISFAIAGDFVYHCHILAHEDSGMMALIRVRSAPAATTATYANTKQNVLALLGLGPPRPRQPLVPRLGIAMCRSPRTNAAPLVTRAIPPIDRARVIQ